jgi:UDP-N-acetylmuramate--alanine ligase
VERRLQYIGEKSSVLVLDDYAHHPTEIRATVGAVKESWGRRLVVLFQPHRFSRTRDLLDDFAGSFDGVDVLVITEIYPAGEDPIDGVSGTRLVAEIKKTSGVAVSFVAEADAMVEQVLPMLREGDIILTMGAGDIWKVGHALMGRLS